MKEFFIYILLDTRKKICCSYTINNNKFNFQYKPFYVGKGKGNRIQQHYGKYNLKKKTKKNNLILKIFDCGLQPISIKLFKDLTENNAYELEKKVISIIGLNNLTNKTDGGVGQCSLSMTGEKNPMFGQHPIPWNKGQKGVVKSKFKGWKLDEIVGKKRAIEIKRKQSEKRKGKSWEEYFGEEVGKRIRIERSEKRCGSKHTKKTIIKMKNSSTPKVRIVRRNASIKTKQKTFDSEMKLYEKQIKIYIQQGYIDNEIIMRINELSKYKLKKMMFLIRNNYNSDYFFKQLI